MTTVPPTLPDKAELKRQQVYLTNEKLRLETRKMKQEAEPDKWWSKLGKTVIPFGTVVTAAVAVATVGATSFGVWDSYNKTIIDRKQVRFEDAIKRLESNSTISKLVGVSVLSGYLNADTKEVTKEVHRQILFTLVGLMATEKDFQIQAAVIDLMTKFPREGPMAQEDWVYFQDMLVSQSRALIAKGNLSYRRHFQSASPLTDEEGAARTLGKLIAINVRKGAVPGYVNYRDIYCAGCDFHGAVFPHSVDFTGAVLDDANFKGARLEAALFDDAEVAGTTFVEADLRQARFRSPLRYGISRTRYLNHIVGALEVNALVNITMPNFSCADLEDANFDYHALFPGAIELRRVYTKSDKNNPGWYQTVPQMVKDSAQTQPKVEIPVALVDPPKFLKANLKNAKFDKINFFSFFSEVDGIPDYISKFGSTIRVAEISFHQGSMHDKAFQIGSGKDNGRTGRVEVKRSQEMKGGIDHFQRVIRAAFFSVDLQHVSLPERLSEFLAKSKPTLSDYESVFVGPVLAEPDADLACTPRRN